MSIKNEILRNDYPNNSSDSTFDYDFRAYNIESFYIAETIVSTGVVTEFTSVGDLDGDIGIAGSGADYIVSGLKDIDGGLVTRAAGVPSVGTDIAIVLRPFIIQDTKFENQGSGFRSAIELEFDRSRQIDLYFKGLFDKTLRAVDLFDASGFDFSFTPIASKFFQINSLNTGVNLVDIGTLGAISLPGSNGIAVYTGSNVFISRTLSKTGDITIDNGDGQSGNPTVNSTAIDTKIATNTTNIATNTADLLVANPFTGTEQDTPDDTVKLTAGIVIDPGGVGPAVIVAAGAADAVTFPVVSADSRIDLLVVDYAGTVTRVAGAEAASPVPPDYPVNKLTSHEVTINDTVTVTINNADIKRVITSINSVTQHVGISAVTMTTHAPAAGSFTVAHNLPSGIKPKEISVHSVVYNGAVQFPTSGTCVVKEGTFSQGCSSMTGLVAISGKVVSYLAGGTSFEHEVTAVDGADITFTTSKTGAPAGQTSFVAISKG